MLLLHIIQICKFKWKCAERSVLQLCMCLSAQIENIDACLSFLAAKGVNIQGLSAEGKLGFFFHRNQRGGHKPRPLLGIKQITFAGWFVSSSTLSSTFL